MGDAAARSVTVAVGREGGAVDENVTDCGGARLPELRAVVVEHECDDLARADRRRRLRVRIEPDCGENTVRVVEPQHRRRSSRTGLDDTDISTSPSAQAVSTPNRLPEIIRILSEGF